MFRLKALYSTKAGQDSIKVPDSIPATMDLQEYKRLKSLNSTIGDEIQRLNRDIATGFADYSSGLRNEEELVANLNKVRAVLRHFEAQMKNEHGVDSGLDAGKQVQVFDLDVSSGSSRRMTMK